jgi:hypothetical protein
VEQEYIEVDLHKAFFQVCAVSSTGSAGYLDRGTQADAERRRAFRHRRSRDGREGVGTSRQAEFLQETIELDRFSSTLPRFDDDPRS